MAKKKSSGTTSTSARLRKIIEIDSQLNRVQDLDILLERILLEARHAITADAGSIYIRNEDKLDVKYSHNDTLQRQLPPGEKLITLYWSVPIATNTVSGYVGATGEILNIPDMYDIPKDAPYNFAHAFDKESGYKTISTLTFPLKTNTGDILGVLQLINPLDAEGAVRKCDKTDVLFAEHFADNATIALQRAQMTRAILLRMISMAELRDPNETGAHVNRVASYAVEIYDRWAHRHDIPERESENKRDILRMASMLHDCGKVAISDLILKKPGPLTDEERAVMKTHTYMGASLFSDRQSEFDEIAEEVAMTHHEWWDGNGYPGYMDLDESDPEKLVSQVQTKPRGGEEIPVFGRIVAIADVYDALSSRRAYKPPWSEEDVIEELHKCAGTQFDPEIVEILVEILPQLRQFRKRYPDQSHH